MEESLAFMVRKNTRFTRQKSKVSAPLWKAFGPEFIQYSIFNRCEGFSFAHESIDNW